MTALALWKALALLAGAPSTVIVVRWLLARLGTRARAEAKEKDRRERERAEERAEMRAYRITRDAEYATMARSLALAEERAERLREDVAHHIETAQQFELQGVRDRGTIQRLSEETERLRRELAECRRFTRLD